MSNPRKANGHQRRKVTAQVYREEDLCALCGKAVDKTRPYIDPATGKPDPWAKSVDEIVPVARGGSATDRSNCRLAHRRCNIRRSDGTRTVQHSGPPALKRLRTY